MSYWDNEYFRDSPDNAELVEIIGEFLDDAEHFELIDDATVDITPAANALKALADALESLRRELRKSRAACLDAATTRDNNRAEIERLYSALLEAKHNYEVENAAMAAENERLREALDATASEYARAALKEEG